MIKNTCPDKSGNPESLKNNCNSSKAFLTNMTIVAHTGCFFYTSNQWKKNCIATVLLAIWENFLHGNKLNYNSYRFSFKLAFVLFLSFFTNQKQEPGFQQVKRVCQQVTRSANKKYFCFLFLACGALLQSHAEFNRIL